MVPAFVALIAASAIQWWVCLLAYPRLSGTSGRYLSQFVFL